LNLKITMDFKKFLTFVFISLTLFSRAGEKAPPVKPAEEIYIASLEMSVQIYRIARDKIYEIYYPDFELLQNDLADAIDILEEKISVVENAPAELHGKEQLQQAVSVWNNLRFHSMRKLEKKDVVRFYYDTQTFDNFLKILREKIEDQYEFNSPAWQELKKRYHLQASVFKVNTGYMTRSYGLAESLSHLAEKEMNEVDRLFDEAKTRKFLLHSVTGDLFAMLMNDWTFLKYSINNTLFTTDLTCFSVSNTIYNRIHLINILSRNEI